MPSGYYRRIYDYLVCHQDITDVYQAGAYLAPPLNKKKKKKDWRDWTDTRLMLRDINTLFFRLISPFIS
jgi:hypothetical protein